MLSTYQVDSDFVCSIHKIISKNHVKMSVCASQPSFDCKGKKFLKKTENATPVKIQMIRMQNNVEKVLVVWIKDQTSHNIPLSQSLI